MEIYRAFDRFFKVWSIQDQCMKAKMQILKRTRDMVVDELLLQVLANNCTKPKLRELLKREVDRYKSLMISGWKKTAFQQNREGY